MITSAIVLFVIAALGGIALAAKSFRGQTIPWFIAIAHGVFAAAGLVVLAMAVLQHLGGDLAATALIVLLVAALGGFSLLSFHMRNKNHPRAVVVIHALVAVAGVVILLIIATGDSAPVIGTGATL
jgi:hypothetical protein